MSELTAIDVLINPDEATIERAREVNARMLTSLPEGWGSGRHSPAAHHDAAAVCAHRGPRPGLRRRREDRGGYRHGLALLPGRQNRARRLGLPRLWSRRAPCAGQPGGARLPGAKLVAAVSPFVESGGTTAAFVADPGEEISPTIVNGSRSTSLPRSGRATTSPTWQSARPSSRTRRSSRPSHSNRPRCTPRASPPTTSATTAPPASS
jgi:hypothetical protein